MLHQGRMKAGIAVGVLALASGLAAPTWQQALAQATFMSASAPLSFGDTLVDAADQGNLKAIQGLIRSGKFVDSEGRFGTTALMRATYRGHHDIVRYLLSVGADPNMTDVGGATPLHLAARQGRQKIVDLLLAHDADINVIDREGWTPLMRASLHGHDAVTARLVASNADVNMQNMIGETALQHATFAGNQLIAEMLLRGGADVTLADKTGLTAADIAFQRGDEDMQQLLAGPVPPLPVMVTAPTPEQAIIASAESADEAQTLATELEMQDEMQKTQPAIALSGAYEAPEMPAKPESANNLTVHAANKPATSLSVPPQPDAKEPEQGTGFSLFSLVLGDDEDEEAKDDIDRDIEQAQMNASQGLRYYERFDPTVSTDTDTVIPSRRDTSQSSAQKRETSPAADDEINLETVLSWLSPSEEPSPPEELPAANTQAADSSIETASSDVSSVDDRTIEEAVPAAVEAPAEPIDSDALLEEIARMPMSAESETIAEPEPVSDQPVPLIGGKPPIPSVIVLAESPEEPLPWEQEAAADTAPLVETPEQSPPPARQAVVPEAAQAKRVTLSPPASPPREPEIREAQPRKPQPAQKPLVSTVVPPAKPGSSAQPMTRQETVAYLLQLGAFDSRIEARAHWDKLKDEHADLMGDLKPLIADTVIDRGRRTIYRTQAGYVPGKRNAERLCEEFFNRNIECFVVERAMVMEVPVASQAAAITPPTVSPSMQASAAKAVSREARREQRDARPPEAPKVPKRVVLNPNVLPSMNETPHDTQKEAPSEMTTDAVAPPARDADKTMPPVMRDSTVTPKRVLLEDTAKDRKESHTITVPEETSEHVELPWQSLADTAETAMENDSSPADEKVSAAAITPLTDDQSTDRGNEPTPQEIDAMMDAMAQELLAEHEAAMEREPAATSASAAVPQVQGVDLPARSTFSAPPFDDGIAQEMATAERLRQSGYFKDYYDGTGLYDAQNGVRVAEAVRVPLTMNRTGAQPPRSMQRRSYSRHQWLHIGRFATDQDARQFWRDMRSAEQDMTRGMRQKVLSPVGKTSGRAVTMRVGPLPSDKAYDVLCDYALRADLSCRVTVDKSAARRVVSMSGRDRHRLRAEQRAGGDMEALAVAPPLDAIPKGKFWVQLGSYATLEQAGKEWAALKDQYADILGGHEHVIIQPVNSAAHRTSHRLRTGPFADMAEALNMCTALKQRNVRCLTLKD